MYGQYSRAVCNKEQFMMARVQQLPLAASVSYLFLFYNLSDLNFADESGILQEFNTWSVLLLTKITQNLSQIVITIFDKFLTTNVGKKTFGCLIVSTRNQDLRSCSRIRDVALWDKQNIYLDRTPKCRLRSPGLISGSSEVIAQI